MALSDSMFLFEIIVEELKSFIPIKEFCIRSQFADIFKLNLKDPNELEAMLPWQRKRKNRRKLKVRKTRAIEKPPIEAKMQTGQSVLFANNIDTLISNMKTYPMELCLLNKSDVTQTLGWTHIHWSHIYIDYLNKLRRKQEPPPVTVIGEYNVFDEFTSKRMAIIKLNIKLTHLKDRVTAQFRSLSEENTQTFMYTDFNSTPTTFLSTIKEPSDNLFGETGITKMIYGDNKRKFKKTSHDKNKHLKKSIKCIEVNKKESKKEKLIEDVKILSDALEKSEVKKSIISLVKSDTDMEQSKSNKQKALVKTKSYSSVISKDNINTLNYIFADNKRQFGNKVYYVGYFTVENDPVSSDVSETPKGRYHFRMCDSECLSKKTEGSCSQSVLSIDLPEEASHLITVKKCQDVECDNRKHRGLPSPPDERIELDLAGLKPCCEKVEEVVGDVQAQMKFTADPCFCSCECRFGFTKKTTYCAVCGGYEVAGEELARKPKIKMPYPCPIFHNLVDKNKLKTVSTSGSESRKKGDDFSQKSKAKTKSVESEKESKGKKKRKDDRFKFNYGYTAPKIGHSQCAFPCTGTMDPVPKSMGWLWTADNVPGLKFRPMWKPGAANKHVVRMLRMARNPGQILAKKKRKDAGKKKKPLKRPLLVVQKKDGEFIITLETMKSYPKPRAINQAPYEEKPVLTYTIGRTDEENLERQRKKEQKQRRLEREQRQFIQSAFRDMCREICVKTYQQALGILPDAEDPECTCYPANPDIEKLHMDVSCSCTESNTSTGTDTDDDEWLVEFTPPSAFYDPTVKTKKVQKVDNTSQYTYLDYRVKLIDRYGNPVPRFFKGPDGKQQCSDLGGFWGPDHKWLEINVDGYIGPDGRWAPNTFIGPNGEQIETDTGKFQVANGKWLIVGVDGFVDSQGKWRFYPKPRGVKATPKKRSDGKKGGAGDKKDDKSGAYAPSEATFSCFGDASPKQLSKMGIVGHGHDRQLLYSTLKDMLAHGEDVRIPVPSTVPRAPISKKSKKRGGRAPEGLDSRSYFLERTKCHHPMPSDKGIIAIDDRGRKTYFRLKDSKNVRPKQRLATLKSQGISLSSFHVPCFHSFINSEVMKQQQRDRLIAMASNAKNVATQFG